MWETDQNFLPCVLDPSPACRAYFQLPLWEGSDSCWFGVKLLYTLKGLISVETDLSCARGETIGFYVCIYYTVTRGSGVCFASTPRENSHPLLGRLLVSVGCSWAVGVRASLFLSCFSFSPETRMICLIYRLLWRRIDWLGQQPPVHWLTCYRSTVMLWELFKKTSTLEGFSGLILCLRTSKYPCIQVKCLCFLFGMFWTWDLMFIFNTAEDVQLEPLLSALYDLCSLDGWIRYARDANEFITL